MGTAVRAQPSRERQVQAVFLFNFAQFVQWPETSFMTPDSPLIIGVLGHDPYGATLDDVVRGEQVGGRALEVRRFQRVEDAVECHILYVSRSEEARFDRIFAALQGRALLTVGDADGFALQGGMIRFVTERGRIRLRVNLEAAREAGLTLSSKLLRSAEIVEGRNE